jgi:NitT/TauT family transport system substrate-binding protein
MNTKHNSGSRRAFLVGAASVSAAVPLGLVGQKVFATPRISRAPFEGAPICTAAVADGAAAAGPLKKISFAWNAGAPCLLGVTVAKEKGFFAKHGLDVDLVNYSGSTDQLLETLATGKADAWSRGLT